MCTKMGQQKGVLSSSVREEKDWCAHTVGVDHCVKFFNFPCGCVDLFDKVRF